MKNLNEELNRSKQLMEIHSDEDMQRGNNLKNTVLGINFSGDYKKIRLAIKKLVRLKSQLKDTILQKQVDDILNLLS